MKTLLFVLNETAEKRIPLHAQIDALAKDRFELHSVESFGQLQEKMEALKSKSAPNSIIISATPNDKLNAFIAECRSIMPACTFITVLGQNMKFTEPLWQIDSQFLAADADDFQISAAISAANQQSSFRANVLAGHKDEVDNLLSRPYFMHRLSEEISISKRHKTPLCCVIFSIEFYRMYLDSYGYQFTNALLRFVGDEMNKLIRYEDQVARVGDDELALLLARCTEADAKKLVQRLADTLNSIIFRFDEYEEALSVCAGVVAYPLPDNEAATADTLVRYAHHAVHQAKTTDEASHCVSMFSEIQPTL